MNAAPGARGWYELRLFMSANNKNYLGVVSLNRKEILARKKG